jgi:TonB-linked SusC/RagA family outer membrane protein
MQLLREEIHMNGPMWKTVLSLAGALALGLWATQPAFAQQTGTIQGTIVEVATNQPLSGVQVSIPGTPLGTLTNAQGRFQLLNVPAGTHNLTAEHIGYGSASRSITVTAGEVLTVNLRLESEAIALQEVVVTGVAGATRRAMVPFVVDQLRMQDLPVPSVSAGSMIQGKVAGATVVSGSGRPGSGASILLRGPTSINASGRNQEPLYIVDGVILAGSFVDFDALDIENIEIVKGAAAASLYGSRAANGVVHISTRRGRTLPEGIARFTVRSEFGSNELPSTIATSRLHPYNMNAAGTRFINADGQEFDYDQRQAADGSAAEVVFLPWSSFQVNPWPGVGYNNMDLFFDPGTFQQHSVALEGQAGRTNYLASFSNMHESGVMPGQEGFKRNNFRLNLDHGLLENLQVNATAFFSRSSADQFSEAQGNPIFALHFIPPPVNLGARDGQGRLEPWPDHRGEEMNPLYVMENRTFWDDRERFLGSGRVAFNPMPWLNFEGGLSYDRLSVNRENFYARGYGMPLDGREPNRPSAQNQGWLRLDNITQDAINAHVQGTVRRSFGDINATVQGRYLFEDQSYDSFYGQGQNLSVEGIPRLGVTETASRVVSSYGETIRSEGFYLLTDFDYLNRYIFSAQVRRDGSSLFGPEERWHTYHRLAGAWRIAQEPFFNVPAINELKLRYSYGTAGNKPSFAAQYEVFSVAGGAPSPVTLGNRALKPEHARESEAGIDIGFLDRFDFSATYASATIEDQILSVPLPGYAGYGTQWQNAGTLASNTWELSLGGTLVQRGNFSWNSRVLFDRTRQEITQLDVPCYTYGLPASNPQGFENAFYACEGEAVGTFYGIRWATSMDDLPADADRSHFQIDNLGYVVYVGPGGSYRDGNWSGTAISHAGRAYTWGVPIRVLNDEGLDFVRIGRTTPDFSYSLSNTFRLGDFQLYGLLDAQHGFDVYNRGRQWAMRDRMSAEMDQGNLAEDERKPVGYFNPTLYAVNNLSSHFVEDGSFLKLRELSLRYNLGAPTLARLNIPAMERASLYVTGRNLITWTDYTGFDPEVGFAGGTAGSAALNRIDSYQYPNFRTYTLGVELAF